MTRSPHKFREEIYPAPWMGTLRYEQHWAQGAAARKDGLQVLSEESQARITPPKTSISLQSTQAVKVFLGKGQEDEVQGPRAQDTIPWDRVDDNLLAYSFPPMYL